MKTILSTTRHTIAMALAATVCFHTGLRPAQAQTNTAETGFPYVIPYELGTWAFAAGDRITITSVRGDRPHLEADGSYLVQGSYMLASVDSAILLFSCTTRNQSGPTPTLASQQMRIARGSGTFSLQHPPCDGQYHVSFYVANEGHSHGGVYFGETGFENTILRQADWPDLSRGTSAEKHDPTPVGGNAALPSADPNRAIMTYLGNPVPAPTNLDAKYTPANLAAAFTALSQKAGWSIRKLSVDDSEFPFLVSGVLAIKYDHLEFRNGLREMKGYVYGGSVAGSAADASTYFALNMIPPEQYPSGQTEACHRRLMVRLQMLADSARQTE